MSFNHHALIARVGNEQGAREEFARLVAALAEVTTRVRRIRENPGDWGIDAFAGRLDDGGDVAVWQAKFFINGIGDSQQQQIRDSFRMAREAAEKHGYQLVRWTLTIPVDLSAIETQWWDGWKERQEAEHGVAVELWDKHRLDTLLRPPDADSIRNEFLPPFAAAEVSSRPIKPLPPGTTYDEMLFIAQLKEAGIGELQAAREEFFNAELLERDVVDKGVEQEVAGLQTVRSETRSLWSHEYNDACEKNAGSSSLPGLHGAVMRAIRQLHLAQGLTPLRLNVVHRFGTMHQVVEYGDAGWVRDFRAVVERHRDG
jgi:hypothetical protein